jgi:hypothetical protein
MGSCSGKSKSMLDRAGYRIRRPAEENLTCAKQSTFSPALSGTDHRCGTNYSDAKTIYLGCQLSIKSDIPGDSVNSR